ncbi:MAG: hypothetical protein ACOY94_09455 [Bacillota bacterium]
MRRWGGLLLVPLLFVLAFGAYLLSDSDAKDRRIWSRFRTELTPDRVTRVEIGHATPITLTDEERSRALALLRQARFRESNRQGYGPTPETILTLHFADGRTIHIGFWGGETFELSPRHLDPRTQFLINSPPLGDLVRQKTKR